MCMATEPGVAELCNRQLTQPRSSKAALARVAAIWQPLRFLEAFGDVLR